MFPSRRDMLRGVGATIALPWLEAIPLRASGATARQTRPNIRLVCIEQVHGAAGSSPYGMQNNLWAPAMTGRHFDLTPTSLKPLERFRDHLTIISNTDVPSADPTDAHEIGGDHYRSSATWLTQTYAKRTEGADVECGISLDQLHAQRFGQDTPLPSMQLCIESVDQSGGCGYGYSCVYTDTISWAAPDKPLPMIRDPRVVFDQMFGVLGNGSADERRQRRQENLSILDFVQESSRRLANRLGAADRARLADYLDNVREIERRIVRAEQQRDETGIEAPPTPVGVPENWEEHVRLQFDLMALALQGNLTRVISFMMARELSTLSYPQIGVADGHHPVSHNNNIPEQVAKKIKIDIYHLDLFAQFLDKLKATPDGDGSLFDHSLFLYGGGMTNGNAHDHENLPTLLVGGGAGMHKGDRHVRMAKSTPLSNLMISLMDKAGYNTDKFGQSSGRIEV